MGCELLGLSQDQIIGKNWFDHFVPPIEWPERRNIFKNFLEGKFGDFFRHEGGILTHDNSHRIMSWLVHGRYSLSGDCIGIFASGKDITRERQLENEKMYALRQIEENVAKFAVSQRPIRNPLCTILTLASMLDDEIIANMITDQVK
jgi:PAS domain S-box-containing protein